MLCREQDHRTLVLWALVLAQQTVAVLSYKYPHEERPARALEAAKAWAAGEIRMRQAQREILACHAFAKEITCREDIAACHAVGQACGVVHTAGHAMGYPIYDLTSIVYRLGVDECAAAVEQRIQEYVDILRYYSAHPEVAPEKWADFLLR